MDRRTFMKMVGVLPMFSIVQIKNTQGLSHSYLSQENTKPLSILNILEDVCPGQLVVIGSRPSVGKSAVALNLLNELAAVQNEGCVYFSIECTQEHIMHRLMCLRSNISHAALKTGKLSVDQYEKLIRASDEISNFEVYMSDSIKVSTELIADQIVALKKNKKNVKYVFIDYLNLLHIQKENLSRVDQMTEALSELKGLAVKENLIIIALSQVNRGVELHSTLRPQPQQLREINNISSIDRIILLNKKTFYQGDQQEKKTQLDFFIYNGRHKAKIDYFADIKTANFKIDHLTAVI